MTLWRILFRIPWHILLIAAALVVVGALALYSASEGFGTHGPDATLCGSCWGEHSLANGVY